MARQKSASPYFKSVHLPPPSPTPTPTLIPFSPRYNRIQYIDSEEMVNFYKLDTKALIEAAVAPSMSQPRHPLEQFTHYTPQKLQSFDTTSRKRTRSSDKASLYNDSLFDSDSSQDTFIAKPSKKQKQLTDENDGVYNVPQRRLQNKGKGHASLAEQTDKDEEDDATFQVVRPAKSKLMTASHEPSSSRKASMVSKPRKSIGTPVPTSLEDAHSADKELFKMKADGKPWKEIKAVWERLMNKKIGDSTLSVRYCKMKENFEKSGGKDDMRILKFKAKVEAELEADKWERVARMTAEDGGKVMTTKEVRLRFKEIERNGFRVSATNGDGGLPETIESDMDAIDRELAGVGDLSSVSQLSGLGQGDVGESVGLEQEDRGEDFEIEGLTQAEQKLIERFGKANGHQHVEFDIDSRLFETVAVEEGTLVDEGSAKLDQEDFEKDIPNDVEVGEGGRSVFGEK